MKLYKYMNRVWANSLLTSGSLRLGSLYSFKDMESIQNDQIADPDEGMLDAYGMYSSFTEKDVPKHAPVKFEKSSNIRVQNFLSMTTLHSENYIIYCLTTEFNEKTMLEFGYDCCLIVEDARSLLSALNAAMLSYGHLYYARKCIYRSKFMSYDEADNLHPAFVKDERFSNQNEFRIAYKTDQDWHPHLDISAKILRKKFKRYYGFS